MSHLFTITGLTASCGKRRFAVESWEQVSRAYRLAISATGLGASDTPRCLIRDSSGRTIAYVSYHGRVWAGHPNDRYDDQGRTPMFDPLPRAT